MAGHFTYRLYFHSPAARENMVACLVKYLAISHSDSCNKYYLHSVSKFYFTYLY